MDAERQYNTVIRRLHIPIRPKCVQSTRFARGHSFVSPDVRKWKSEILEVITPTAPDTPANGPVRILSLVYGFQLPAAAGAATLLLCSLMLHLGETITGKTKKARLLCLRDMAAQGIAIPYMAKADLMDNLNKGLMDCFTGLYWYDDKQIWENCGSRKIYSNSDFINIEMELTYE